MNNREHYAMHWETRIDNKEVGHMFTPEVGRSSGRYPWNSDERVKGWVPFALATPSDYRLGGPECFEIVFDDCEDEPVRKYCLWNPIGRFYNCGTREVYPEPIAWRTVHPRTVPAKRKPLVSDVKTYNEKVVIVEWSDGTQTKSICSDNDVFDFDFGVTICILKKYLEQDGVKSGTKAYNDLMDKIHSMPERKKKLEAYRQKLREQRELGEGRRRRKAAKKRQKRIEEAARIFVGVQTEETKKFVSSDEYKNYVAAMTEQLDDWAKCKEDEMLNIENQRYIKDE